METSGRKRYYVLYTQERQQTRVKNTLKDALPEERGEVFCPCMEYYIRGREKPGIKPMFPGYIFVHTDMNARQVHDFVRSHSAGWQSFVRELGFGNSRTGEHAKESTVMSSGESNNNDDCIISDLSPCEEEFLDFLFGVGVDEPIKENSESSDGLLRMSYGYREKDRYIVMQGPLKHYEDKIVDVNRHDRKAFLDFKMKDCLVKAGFEVKPKQFWFPKGRDVVYLDDGFEVNTRELVSKMMK